MSSNTIFITKKIIWFNGLSSEESLTDWANQDIQFPEIVNFPKPEFYPKNQLRRLSNFSKVVLNSLDFPEALTGKLPLIFASRHGDLTKTVKLIKNTVMKDDLSPTQFALSVHNATTGLYGIATQNTAPTTTISAGKHTFSQGLIEACLQVTQEKTDVLYCYCDFPVPDEYQEFCEPELPVCISMLLTTSKNISSDIKINLTSASINNQSNEALEFINYVFSTETGASLDLKNLIFSRD